MSERTETVLSLDEARRVYNRIGRLQDWQRFYEGPPVTDMIEHAGFESAKSIYELGCGTGALARRLLSDHLDPAAIYRAVDLSDTMVELASTRLAPWADRCRVNQVDGSIPLPGNAESFDRFVVTYVFDLLGDAYAAGILEEARRLLTSDGKVCAVGLTYGSTPASRVTHRAWRWMWRRAPRLVGGCRPIALAPLLSDGWDINYRRVVTARGFASEVIIATPKPT